MTESDDDELVEAARYPFLHLAEFAASVLEGSNVECFVGDQFAAGIRPELIFTSGGVKLFVRASDLDRARDVLAELESSTSDVPNEEFDDEPDEES